MRGASFADWVARQKGRREIYAEKASNGLECALDLHEQISELGFIDYNGHLEVHSSLLNVILHDQPQTSAAARVPPRSLRELSTRLCRGMLETSSSAL